MIEGIAKSVARAYRRKVWWADFEDMSQEAFAEMRKAEPLWDARVGIPKSAYLRRVAVLAVRKMLWKQSAPVSGRGERELRGLMRAEMTEMGSSGQPPDEEVNEKRWHERVAERLRELADRDPSVREGLAMLLGEESPMEREAASGVARVELYRHRRRARRAVLNDPVLFELFRSL